MKTKNTKVDIPSIHKINASKKTWKFVSFFAGCGGASTGYKMAGGDCLYVNEFIPIAADTYKANASPHTIVDKRDIRKIDPVKLMAKLGLKRGQLDLMDGSPPCKAFSTSGVRDKKWGEEVLYSEGVKQRVDDLFDEYVRMVAAFMPKILIAENVAGLAKGKALPILKQIIQQFRDLGYMVDARLFDPSYLGSPQRRSRLIIIGVRNDIAKKLKLKAVPYPKPRQGVVTVQDHLPHIARIRTAKGYNTSYVPATEVSPTIMASDSTTTQTGVFSGGGWCEDDKGVRRKYKIKELKKLFTFPDDFKLLGTFEQQWERLGRSHVPLSTYHLGRVLRDEVLKPLREYNASS